MLYVSALVWASEGKLRSEFLRFQKVVIFQFGRIRVKDQGRSQGVPQVCTPLLKKNLHLVKKYNMNKQNYDLTFLGKFIY